MSLSLEYLCEAVNIVEDINYSNKSTDLRNKKRPHSVETFNHTQEYNDDDSSSGTKRFKSYSASSSPHTNNNTCQSRLQKAKELSRHYKNTCVNHQTQTLEYNLALLQLIEQQKLYLLSQIDPYLAQYHLLFNPYAHYFNYLTCFGQYQHELQHLHQQQQQQQQVHQPQKPRKSCEIKHSLKENWCEVEAVNEHFKRSLGKDYESLYTSKASNVSNQVDDHFARALGNETWSKLNEPCKTQL